MQSESAGEWSSHELRTLVRKIRSGATPRGGAEAYLVERVNYALVRSQNVFDHRFESNGLAYITDKQARDLSGAELEADDVLLNITGDGVTFGRSCVVPSAALPACVNQHVMLIRVNPAKCVAGYLASWLALPETKSYIESFNAGGSRRAITKGHIEAFQVPLPPLAAQHSIAAVSDAINHRIDFLRQTNASLESIAQALFKSWFIDFDPVSAKAEGREPEGMDAATAALFPDEFEDSALGLIPKGWRTARLGSLLELPYGKALKATDRRPGQVPVYGSGGITGYHDEPLVNHASIIVGRKGTVGALYWEDRPFFPIDTTFYVRPKAVPLTFCFYALQRLGLEQMNTDAAVPGLNRENAYRLDVVHPTSSVVDVFDDVATALRKAIRANSERVETLAQIRDSLLPRLISGKLRLPETQEQLEDSLA